MATAGNSRRTLSEAPFLGREVEIDGLSAALRKVLRGKPLVAIVSGEAGVGKTRLVREFVLMAKRLDVHVVQGRATEDSSIPYLPLMSVLRLPALGALGHLAEGTDPPERSGGARTGAVSATSARESAQNGEHERLRTFLAVTHEIIALARRQPLALVLDDVHWADASTLDLVGHLVFAAADAAETDHLPLLVLLAHRPVPPDHRLDRLLERIRRESLGETVALEGLSTADTAQIMLALETSPASNQLVQTVHAMTRGYPLFIQEFLDQLRTEGALEEAGGTTTVKPLRAASYLPGDPGATVGARLKALGSEDLRVLTLAALLGDSFSADRLAHVAGVEVADLAGPLGVAVEERVLISERVGFRFRHPLLRAALAAALAPGERQAMHLRIATALASSDPDTSGLTRVEIANHLLGAGPQADLANVVEHARRGAEYALSVFAWSEAARLYAAAADAATGTSTPPSALGELHFLAGLAHQHDFDVGPCLDRYSRAMRAFGEANDFEGQARTLWQQTRTYMTTGTPSYGAALDLAPHERVLEALGNRSPLVRGMLLAAMSQVCWVTRDSARSEALARGALELGEQCGDDRLQQYATLTLGLAQFQGGKPDEARVSYERSLEHARRAGDSWMENPPLQRLSLVEHARGHLDDAERLALQGKELTARVAYAAEASYAYANLTTIAVTRGRLREAETLAREAVTLARRSHYPWGGVIALVALASARALQGRFRDAGHALRLLSTPGELFDQPGAQIHFLVTASVDLFRVMEGGAGSLDDIRGRIGHLGSLLAVSPFDAASASALATVVEIASAVGVPDAARVAHGRLARLFDEGIVLTSGGIFSVPRVLALGSALLGDGEGAERQFQAAEASARAAGARPELGRSFLDHAGFLLRRGASGAREAAGERALDAAAIFDELGMHPYFQRACRLAEECGRIAPLPAARHSKDELDPREVELLQRVARGKSPHEIAAEWLLDPESVAVDIERLYAKIDVSGPALAAAYAFGQGILGPASSPPRSGPLVLMVTDMVGFTSFVERVGDMRGQTTIHVHNRAIRFQLARHRGSEVTHTGDGIMASFASGDDAVACAHAIQAQLAHYSVEHPDRPIRVRIGLNAGRVLPEENRLFGAALNAAVRVCAQAEAGQVLLSANALATLSEPNAARARSLGTFPLKGFATPIGIYELPRSA
jgi:class 3 adenylate cyclase/tetratricopeptide (TPR) repeat protein